MKNRITYIAFGVFVILLFIGVFFYKKSEKVNYEFVGKYEFEIINDSLFKSTYLHESFGYVIGDINIPGIRIKGRENLDTGTDYIISLWHPLKSVHREEDGFYGKVPVIAEQTLEIETQHLYIYDLNGVNEYRLQLP